MVCGGWVSSVGLFGSGMCGMICGRTVDDTVGGCESLFDEER